jgi:hypothetical protein
MALLPVAVSTADSLPIGLRRTDASLTAMIYPSPNSSNNTANATTTVSQKNKSLMEKR